MRKITLELLCELSDAEVLQRASDLSAAITQYEDTERRKAAVTKEFKEELEDLRQTRLRLSRAIGDRAERRAVECGVLYHTPVQGTKRTVRLDTGEYLRDEPMEASELQMHLYSPSPEPEQISMPTDTAPGASPEVEPEPEPEQPVAD